MDDVIIRPAQTVDVESIGRLWGRLVAYHRQLDARMPIAKETGSTFYQQQIRLRLSDPDFRILVAEHNEKIVGYILGALVDSRAEMFHQEKSGHIADIFVAANYRANGIGRRLAKALIGWFRSQEAQQLEWNIAIHNAAAINFWKSLGGSEFMLQMRLDL
jgi:GNAT superfamily N-acetyltransferase